MTKYVCAFVFDERKQRVALIEKKRGPAKLKGFANGIGGKVEPGETPEAAMEREFLEETGVRILNFEKFAVLTVLNGDEVYFFRAFNNDVYQVRTMEEERVSLAAVSTLHLTKLFNNLRYLIPMALHMDLEEAEVFHILEGCLMTCPSRLVREANDCWTCDQESGHERP